MSKPENYPDSPVELWKHFYDITQVPRPSGEEAALRDHIQALAMERGCETTRDEIGNLLIRVPGSAGRENEATVIVQNHLDMVTVKTDDKTHDFFTDPLSLTIEDGWLLADRTTLGADNGVGCAAALALLTDESISHPPLELLFTVEEETGLFGATDLDAGMLSGTRMLNLDTEDWGELYVGCAGGRGWIMRRSLDFEDAAADAECWRLTLRGLAGGHSGIQIHQQLGNAIKLLGQWLQRAESLGVRICSFEGGVAHNVIPREATLVFCCPHGQQADLEALNQELRSAWLSYLPQADAALEIELQAIELASPLVPAQQALVRQLLLLFPHGAISYNAQQPADLVDLSINLAVVRVDADGLFLESTLRYFNQDEAAALEQQVLVIAEWLAAELEYTIDYPGWQPDFDGELLQLASDTYKELYGQVPAVKAIHAGLECGIIKSKKPDVDTVSFGPTIRGAHSPRERLEIATVEPFWNLLVSLLNRI